MVEFLGDVESVSDVQKDLIRSVFEENGYKDGKVTVEAVGKKGDNYIAHVKRFKVVDGTFSLIAKIAPTSPLIRAMMNTKLLFLNEILMYKEYLPNIVKMQKDAGVPEDQLFRYPKFYGSVDEEPYEVVLLEDLKPLDYVMLDRLKAVPNETVKLALKNLAIIHCVSFVMKRSEPEKFDYFAKKLLNLWGMMKDKEEMKAYTAKMQSDIVELLHNESYKSAANSALSTMLENSALQELKALECPQSVIVQGDCWINNVMYKLKGDVPENCILIDYQMSKIGIPVDDLLYFILCCTDYDTRSKHFDEWKDYYHSELGAALSNYDLKIEEVYPKEVFQEHFKKYGKYSLSLSLLLAGMLVRESKDTFNMDDFEKMKMEEMLEESRVTNLDQNAMKRFREKIEGILKSAFEYGFI